MDSERKIEITPVSEDTIEFQRITDSSFREHFNAINNNHKKEIKVETLNAEENSEVKENKFNYVDNTSSIMNELFSSKNKLNKFTDPRLDKTEYFHNDDEEIDEDVLEKTLSPDYSDLRSSIDEAMVTGEFGVIDNSNPVIEEVNSTQLVTSTGFVNNKLLIIGGIVIVVIILIIILLLVL